MTPIILFFIFFHYICVLFYQEKKKKEKVLYYAYVCSDERAVVCCHCLLSQATLAKGDSGGPLCLWPSLHSLASRVEGEFSALSIILLPV